MANFFRITDNKLSSIGSVDKLGFDEISGYFIPNDYLQSKEFTVMRTCHGIGDWCIISAIPRLLKLKYPDCKVYVPSKIMLKNIFGSMLNTWGYGTYNSENITSDVFKYNPYVDKFIDNIDGEIYHDHYRIYNSTDSKIPLAEQMLMFWQFNENEFSDSMPEIYFGEEDIVDIKYKNKYGYISVSSTYGKTSDGEEIVNYIKNIDISDWYYYGENKIEDTNLNFLKNVIDVKSMNLTIRQQMYLKANAELNIGNETGLNLWSTRYSKTVVLGNKYYGLNHGGVNQGKPRKDPFSSGNFIRNVIYI